MLKKDNVRRKEENSMKTDIAELAVELLSPEERALLRRLGEREAQMNAPVTDMEIRAGLCSALAEMSEAMRALLGFMARHNFVTLLADEAFPPYAELIDRIGAAATRATHIVERSRSLDREMALTNLPEGSKACQ